MVPSGVGRGDVKEKEKQFRNEKLCKIKREKERRTLDR